MPRVSFPRPLAPSSPTALGMRMLFGMDLPNRYSSVHGEASVVTPEVDVVIEIPRGSFLKRGSTGHIDFVSPLPCPFNYGSVPQFVGLDGDLLDAVVLGPRLTVGTRLKIRSWGAVTLIDRGMADDKLICSHRPLSVVDQQRVLRFFRFYARCKGLLNWWRRRPGRNACDGWRTAGYAFARARIRERSWREPSIEF